MFLYVYWPCVELVVWSTLGPVLGLGEAPLLRSQSPWSTSPPRLLQLHMLSSKSQNPWGGQWASVSCTSSNAMSPSWVGPAFTPSTMIWNTKCVSILYNNANKGVFYVIKVIRSHSYLNLMTQFLTQSTVIEMNVQIIFSFINLYESIIILFKKSQKIVRIHITISNSPSVLPLISLSDHTMYKKEKQILTSKKSHNLWNVKYKITELKLQFVFKYSTWVNVVSYINIMYIPPPHITVLSACFSWIVVTHSVRLNPR